MCHSKCFKLFLPKTVSPPFKRTSVITKRKSRGPETLGLHAPTIKVAVELTLPITCTVRENKRRAHKQSRRGDRNNNNNIHLMLDNYFPPTIFTSQSITFIKLFYFPIKCCWILPSVQLPCASRSCTWKIKNRSHSFKGTTFSFLNMR